MHSENGRAIDLVDLAKTQFRVEPTPSHPNAAVAQHHAPKNAVLLRPIG